MRTLEELRKEINGKQVVWVDEGAEVDALMIWPPNGEQVSVKRLMRSLRRDRRFFDNSGGGVTITGGEPLFDVPKMEAVARFCVDELNVPLHTHTNGTLVTEDMCQPGGVLTLFESISVTFLGGDAETHDYMTKTKGSLRPNLL